MPNHELDQPPLFNRITLLRELGGLSLNQAAQKSGLSPAYLHKLETGQINSPSPHKLRALAEGTGMRYIHLLALAGYHPEISPAEVDPVEYLKRELGLQELDFDGARFLLGALRELRAGKEAGIPAEVTGDIVITAIRARAGDDDAMDRILDYTELAMAGKLNQGLPGQEPAKASEPS